MRDYTDNDDGVRTQLQGLISELQTDIEKVAVLLDQTQASDDVKHLIASIADRLDGVADLADRR
ncbi:conserved hypothetical protein [Gluconacetobacter diazotrophicus PA1 5]|uniref:Uncharacterized protein n=1 Tax=Gluconacetobacter diazotrophicus TaxID=33996 RepID=A0A7W4I3U3_GLUDI|nr:hypothetical protein [Gluconacetobacter diazotrophicus]ACI51693.1 conserved hypothetical protein [Gluconacetobacter diazotrophicus PA1 5]MBB2155267.1 hypothetical protein [Gluconacetobacter diazotrophicus]TWB11037.1 hypothetical protein FBZ86_10162 [Gluconacetobacter diazotrophicus]